MGVALDSAGNLYTGDTITQRVRKVSNGVITTVGEMGYGVSTATTALRPVPSCSGRRRCERRRHSLYRGE